jgi:hypothetical protein
MRFKTKKELVEEGWTHYYTFNGPDWMTPPRSLSLPENTKVPLIVLGKKIIFHEFHDGIKIKFKIEDDEGLMRDPRMEHLVVWNSIIVRQYTTPQCQHEWINVGFNLLTLACKHCDKSK